MHVVVQLLHVDDYVLIYYVHVDTLYTCTVVVQLLHVDDYVCIYYVHVDTLCTCMLVLCEYMCIQNMNVY